MLNTARVFLHRYQKSSVTINDAQGRAALKPVKTPWSKLFGHAHDLFSIFRPNKD